MISTVTRFRIFMPAAPRILRMDSAIRPWRPITFPRSLGWARIGDGSTGMKESAKMVQN
jgi:hypothetical protein